MGSYTNIAYGHMTSDLLKLLFSAIGCQQHLRFLLSVFLEGIPASGTERA